jgi:hypothetical protein
VRLLGALLAALVVPTPVPTARAADPPLLARAGLGAAFGRLLPARQRGPAGWTVPHKRPR